MYTTVTVSSLRPGASEIISARDVTTAYRRYVSQSSNNSAGETAVEHGQGKHCTYNVTFKRISVTIVAVENNTYCIICVHVCGLRYPARKAHAHYCHLKPTLFYNILPHCLTD
jgi:hypothetical protein